MRRGGLRAWPAAAAAVIVVTFALQLALAAWNRGDETARLELTGASLSLPWSHESQEGEPLSLGLAAIPSLELRGEELAALGFPLERMERWRADDSTRSPLARSLWVVLDHSPQGWERYVRQRREELRRREEARERRRREGGEAQPYDLEHDREVLQRLLRSPRQAVIVAAGLDRNELRRRFPDRARQAVARGTVTASRDREEEPWTGHPRLVVDALTVPAKLHGRVRALIAEWNERRGAGPEVADEEPAFRAVVAWGRRHEPWLVTIEPLAAEGATPERR